MAASDAAAVAAAWALARPPSGTPSAALASTAETADPKRFFPQQNHGLHSGFKQAKNSHGGLWCEPCVFVHTAGWFWEARVSWVLFLEVAQ